MKTKFFSLWTAVLLLLVTSGTLFNEANASKKRLPIEIGVDGNLLTVTSTGGTGTIKRLQVKQGSTVLITQSCPNTNVCSVNISSLSSGSYTVVAICTNETLELPFSK
jgi:hypothetical protein